MKNRVEALNGKATAEALIQGSLTKFASTSMHVNGDNVSKFYLYFKYEENTTIEIISNKNISVGTYELGASGAQVEVYYEDVKDSKQRRFKLVKGSFKVIEVIEIYNTNLPSRVEFEGEGFDIFSSAQLYLTKGEILIEEVPLEQSIQASISHYDEDFNATTITYTAQERGYLIRGVSEDPLMTLQVYSLNKFAEGHSYSLELLPSGENVANLSLHRLNHIFHSNKGTLEFLSAPAGWLRADFTSVTNANPDFNLPEVTIKGTLYIKDIE